MAPFLYADPPRGDYPVTGLFAEKYKRLGGSNGPLGRPTSNEIEVKGGKARYQSFEHGVLGSTPSTGPKSVQAAYIKDFKIVFEWGDTSPFNYDFFLVRWDLNGKNVGQDEVKAATRSSGRWVTQPDKAGRYSFLVEGGVKHVTGSKFHQGWTNSLFLDYLPPGPEYARYRPPVKEPQPPSRPLPRGVPAPEGLYLKEWMRLGGPNGPMGLPVGGVRPHPRSKGGVVPFQNGQIGVSPDVWEKGVLAAYQDGGGVVVDWIVSWGEPHPPSHFNYDKFIVRWDRDGKNIGQVDVNADGDFNADTPDTHLRTRGLYRFNTDGKPGDYSIVVEGADTHGVFGSKAHQGWMKPVSVHFVPPPNDPKFNMFSAIDLSKVPPSKSVADAKAKFDKRAAAAVLCGIGPPLPHTDYKNEEGFGVQALARLAYPDYFHGDHLPGRDYRARDEIVEALRRQGIGSKAGSTNDSLPKRTGEYDVALSMLTAVAYKYYDVLPPDVQDHVVNVLLNKRGPYDPDDASPLPGIPETENHLNGIESARYLANQLHYLRSGNPKYDNSRNGMDEWMLKHLQQYLKTDFIEYNARPYQDYTLMALLNLYSYASAKHPSSLRVKTAARMVLDYLTAKAAVSTNDSRRSATYRRKATYNTPHFINDHHDPMTAFSMAFAGTTDMATTPLPAGFGVGMQWAGLSDYRIPDIVLDLMVERSHREFFQRFHHYADEAYAGSPSYLISSGGHYATFAYKFAGLAGKHDDVGLALPTTFMPTGQFKSRDYLIQFRGAKEDDKRSNMGVAPDFACGLDPFIHDAYKSVAKTISSSPPLKGYIEEGPWTFIDQSTPNLRKAAAGVECYTPTGFGYYVAVYRRDGFGFLEAHDTIRTPGVKFREFKDKVQKQNAGVVFSKHGRNTYTMSDRRKVAFEIAPDSQVFLPSEKPYFLSGTILTSALHSGVVTIENPSLKKRLVLDFHDWKAPKRQEN